MKKEIIRKKFTKYIPKDSNVIVLEVLQGKLRSPEGGLWIEADLDDMERVTEAPDFDPVKSGWDKYLNKWHTEGLITLKEKNTGKS